MPRKRTEGEAAATVPSAAMEEVARIRSRLRMLIHMSPLTGRQVERRAGFSKGYLSQLMCGNIDLKYHHLIGILSALDLAASTFFAELYPQRPSRLLDTLTTFRRRSRPLDHELRLQLARLYGLGLASLEELSDRLDRCEDALAELEAQGILESSESRS